MMAREQALAGPVAAALIVARGANDDMGGGVLAGFVSHAGSGSHGAGRLPHMSRVLSR